MNFVPEGVILSEYGILEKDGIFFYSASDFARESLFYPMWGAKYLCASPYVVSHRTFDAFLLFYITDGELYFTCRGQSFTAGANDIVLLDCKHPHEYHARGPVRFYWFHFRGAASQAYCDRLWERAGAHFPNHPEAEQHFARMQQLLRTQAGNDDSSSVCIHRLLALLNAEPSRSLSPPVVRAKNYIFAHYQENISVDDIAAQAALSRYHFSRIFRTEVGTSPHSYLTEVRLLHAKQLLLETSDSIEQIAAACAFCSSSNFIRTFRRINGLTPAKFRQMFHSL
ncbi:helix-turn-helix domain-containing protein [Butyricicoccus sp.]|uniref:helix-turn-helix domain-containing protein n=1 Tax=Butyricicoccus sp. TaxID=2049021 RepID=UPI003F136F95